MLTSTFIHAPGIGPATEKLIWDSGTTDWQQFMKCHGEIGLSPCQLSMLLPTIEDSIDHYDAEDFEYFARKLPAENIGGPLVNLGVVRHIWTSRQPEPGWAQESP